MSKRTRRRAPVVAGSRPRRAPMPQPRRRVRLLAILGSAAVVVAVIVAVAVLVNRPAGVAGGSLPGTQTGAPPWPPEISHLRARVDADSLPALTAEGQAQHTHEHLDLFVDGQPVTVPTDIGIDQIGGLLSPLHTHDATGIIHVESPVVRTFTLGEFFDVWGVRFDGRCVGGTCDTNGRAVSVYLNGQLFTGDPRSLVLDAHEEIVVAIGLAAALPSPIPSSYTFPAGL